LSEHIHIPSTYYPFTHDWAHSYALYFILMMEHNEKFNYIKFWCDLNMIIIIECILLKFHWGMKALMELHFQHEALPRFIENVLRSTLSYPNETSKECIQFLGPSCSCRNGWLFCRTYYSIQIYHTPHLPLQKGLMWSSLCDMSSSGVLQLRCIAVYFKSKR
jgi:hypothetical protein